MIRTKTGQPKNFFVLAVVSVFVAMGAWNLLKAFSHSAEFFASSRSYDLGVLDDAVGVSKEIEIFNRGNSALELASLRTSCGCTGVSLQSSVVPPGESTTMIIRVDTNKTVGQDVSVFFETNDPNHSKVVISLSFDVASRKPVFSPTSFDFGRVSREELPSERSVELLDKNHLFNSKETKLSFSSSSDLKLENELTSTGRLTIRLDKDVPIGGFSSKLNVWITSEEIKQEVQIPVFGTIVGDRFAVPSSVVFLSGETEKSVRIESRADGIQCEIIDVELSEEVADQLNSSIDGNSLRLTRLTKDAPDTASMTGTCLITSLRDQDNEPIQVPIRLLSTP